MFKSVINNTFIILCSIFINSFFPSFYRDDVDPSPHPSPAASHAGSWGGSEMSAVLPVVGEVSPRSVSPTVSVCVSPTPEACGVL